MKTRPFTDAKDVAAELGLSRSYVGAVKRMLVAEGKVSRHGRWLSAKMVKQWIDAHPHFRMADAWKTTEEGSDQQTHEHPVHAT